MTDSLFKSTLDDTCEGTMYEGLGCNTRKIAIYNGMGNILTKAGKGDVRFVSTPEMTQAIGLFERLGEKELTPASSMNPSLDSKKVKTISPPAAQASKASVGKAPSVLSTY